MSINEIELLEDAALTVLTLFKDRISVNRASDTMYIAIEPHSSIEAHLASCAVKSLGYETKVSQSVGGGYGTNGDGSQKMAVSELACKNGGELATKLADSGISFRGGQGFKSCSAQR